MEDPPKKFHRLSPGKEIRLQNAYYIRCDEVIKDANGEIAELHCSYDPESRGGWAKDGRKVKGTCHWVAECAAIDGEVRLYDRLFAAEDPENGELRDQLNPDSLRVIKGVKLEAALGDVDRGERFQFLRSGYFVADGKNKDGMPVFSRIVTMKDSFKKGK